MKVPDRRPPRGLSPTALTTARRVLVIGCPGAGKTTFAVRLAALTGLPVVHLDDLYFGPGWSATPPEEWRAEVRRLSAGQEWVVDGNHAATLPERLARAEAVVLIDRAPVLCLAAYLRRLLRHARAAEDRLPHYMRLGAGRRRVADRPVSFARFILAFRRRTLPGITACLAARGDIPVVVLRSRADAEAVLTDLGRGLPTDRTGEGSGRC
ncbi:hypothetical protein ABT282_05510 [Streptomyces sp. NPDC000927]|uniref:hypothetical protein n=1 Tax=Streptomyces sp. NPDC000927 TaxID=3154371 RepID=UPI0033325461